MNMAEAVRSVLSQYANFNGRARRSEYWFWVLSVFILNIVVGLIDAAIGSPVLGYIEFLALVVPGLAVACRRLHDTGRSGWWQFLLLIPVVGVIILIVWWATDSKPAGDKYGPSPKYHSGMNQGPPTAW